MTARLFAATFAVLFATACDTAPGVLDAGVDADAGVDDAGPPSCAEQLDQVELLGASGPVTITAVTPAEAAVGSRALVEGAGFDSACIRVRVGDVEAAGVVASNASRLAFNVPALAPGAADVEVVTPAGVARAADALVLVDGENAPE